MRLRPLFVVPLALAAAIPAARAQTSFPMITHTTPVAVQRGKTTEVVVNGQMNFAGTYKALFEGSGITAEILALTPAKSPAKGKGKPIPPGTVRSVKLRLTVAPDAALGVREFRLAAALGISSIGQIVVVDEPVIEEKSVNNTLPQAQAIALPCVVAGRLEAVEDVDFFKFQAEAGQTLTFEVFCARLQDRIHDLQKHAKPMLTLYDGEGRELAQNDHFYFADPLLTYTVPKSGTYYVQIRESTYDGEARWVYALRATNKPYVSHVYPMAGNPGAVLEVEPVGSASKLSPRVKLQLPKEPGLHHVRLDVGGMQTNPVPVLVSALPQFVEQEPNDEPAKATRAAIPCGINGRIGKKRDLDHFVFAAKKGQAIRFETKARRFGTPLCSSLHAVLDVLSAKGAVIASNDDTHGKEAALVFTPPADGEYVLRVRDLNSKGGDTAIYHIEADLARPDFVLQCDPDKAMIGPGTSTAWYVNLTRLHGFAGPVRVEVKGLPKDVTASPLIIGPTMTQGAIVLTAGPNAKLDAANVQVIGTSAVQVDGKAALVRTATPRQEIYLPGGGRGLFDVHMQTVAVTAPSDILRVDISTTKVSLKPGQEVRIEVTVHRRKDYDKNISLDVVLAHLGRVYGNPLPPGVTVVPGKSKTLLGKTSKGHIVLKAAPNAAPVEDVPIGVLCHVSINFVVKVSYSSPPILVSVRK